MIRLAPHKGEKERSKMPQLGPEHKLGFNNPVCWLLGHDVSMEVIEKSRRSVSGEITAGSHYYCKRCQDPKNFPTNQFPDRRSLYRRTIPVWILKLQNRWQFRNTQRNWERGKKDFHLFLDEQRKKYGDQTPKNWKT